MQMFMNCLLSIPLKISNGTPFNLLIFNLKHRLFAHRQYNAPDSIQSRNLEQITAEKNIRTEQEELRGSAKKLRKIQTFDEKSLSQQGSMEVDQDVVSMHSEPGVKFMPKPPPKSERFTSPIGRKHSRGPKTSHAIPAEVKSIDSS